MIAQAKWRLAKTFGAMPDKIKIVIEGPLCGADWPRLVERHIKAAGIEKRLYFC